MSDTEFHLYLVRHGQTEANVDRTLYQTKADHAVLLTPTGIRQAERAGAFLAGHLHDGYEQDQEAFGKVRLWHSPYYRARATAAHILAPMGKAFAAAPGVLSYREDPFLFEQRAGLLDGLSDEEYMARYPNEAEDFAKNVRFNGRAYAHTPMGESRIDIVIRVKHFFGTILDDLRRHRIRHAVVVNHGVTVRAMTMGWMRYPPEWLDAEKNPGNCWIRHIHGSSETGYVDEGYIFGDGAPLHDVMATQKTLENPELIYMLKPGRANAIVPRGVIVVDPFATSPKG